MKKEENFEKLVKQIEQEMRRGFLVLGVLSKLDKPQYGYSLLKELNDAGIEIAQETLYPLLRRLEQQGVVSSEWKVENDTRPRKYYLLNDKGRILYEKLKDDWHMQIEAMEVLLK